MNKLKDINDIDDRFIEEAAPGMASREEMQKAFPEENEGNEKIVPEMKSGNVKDADEAKVVDISAAGKGKPKKAVNFKKWAGIAAAVVAVCGIAFVLKGGPAKKAYDTAITDNGGKGGLSLDDKAAEDVKKGAETPDKSSESADRTDPRKTSDGKKGAKTESGTAEADESMPGGTDDFKTIIPDKKSDGSYDGEIINSIGEESFPGDGVEYEPVPDGEYTEVPGGPDPDPYIPSRDPDAQAMLLTAGVWNDNSNWGFFTNLVNTGKVSFPTYGLNPVNRIAVTVNDETGNPLSGCVVCGSTGDYLENGSAFFTARTDKKGKAYLFASDKVINEKIYISVFRYKEGEYELIGKDSLDEKKETASGQQGTEKEDAGSASGNGTDDQQRRNVTAREITVTAEGQSVKKDKTQVMFIVDTTGSMGDELAYLQMDFSKIVDDVKAEGISYSVNFYRDHGDDYVTKCNGFSTDIKEIQTLINDEYAAGGGDTPEAVVEILEETITRNDSWSEDCNKIAFLIFDAPPHEGSENEQKLVTAIASAAERGIRLVPVVASGSERDTELFGRAMAIMTNGEYVFLTDDSGIGGSHLEPIIGDYEVEKLHDVIVRIIEETAE